MAILKTDITSGSEPSSAGTSSVTASFQPTGDSLVIAAVQSGAQDSTTPSQPSLSGGAMTTWTAINGIAFDDAGTVRSRIDWFRSQQANPGSAAALTISGGDEWTRCWSIFEFANVAIGNNGADAIRVVNNGSASSTTNSITGSLSSLADTANRIVVAATDTAQYDTTLEANYTQIHRETPGSAQGMIVTGWRDNDTPDLSPNATCGAGTVEMGMLHLELIDDTPPPPPVALSGMIGGALATMLQRATLIGGPVLL